MDLGSHTGARSGRAVISIDSIKPTTTIGRGFYADEGTCSQVTLAAVGVATRRTLSVQRFAFHKCRENSLGWVLY